MSRTVSRGPEAGQHAEILPAGAPQGRSRRRGRWVALGVVVMVAGGAVAAWRAGAFSPTALPGSGHQGAPPPATAAVTRRDIAATTPVTATLGYAGSYAVTGQGGGTLTWLPSPGQVVRQGQALYQVGNGSPVVLLYGSVPDWRAMQEGITGQDVSQLNHDLVDLGYASRADVVALGWDYYSWETAAGVQKLEEHLGVSSPPGRLSLGQVVFEPQALRVSQVTGRLGGSVTGPVLKATSDRHVVTIQLDTSQQSQVQAGDKVTVTLPDGAATPGTVSSVGTVATTTPGSGGSGSTTTIPVHVTLTHPGAAGTLDQAPVTVNITTASVKNALVVPVTALLAQASGGYQVEVAGPGDTRRWVPVQPGIFDAATLGLPATAGTSLAQGRYLNAATARQPVAVLGATTAQLLGIDRIRPGMRIWVGPGGTAGQWFYVTGILNPDTYAPEIDSSVLVGFPAAEKYLGFDGHPSEIYVRTTDTQAAVTRVDSLLGAQASPENPSQVNVSRPSDALTARAETQGALDTLFLGLGAVALLVGAIGVANIMVISVLECRQEIGLRRALGATRGQIRIQFLAEAIMLSLAGCVTGVIAGATATAAYARGHHEAVVIPPEAWAGGLATAVIIGALAGPLPAIRAARLPPTQALWTV